MYIRDYLVIITLFFFSENIEFDDGDNAAVDDFIAAVYDRKTYVGKVIEVHDADAYMSFLNYDGDLTTSTTFSEPKQADEVCVKKENVLYIVPQPNGGTEGKRAGLFQDIAILETIIRMLSE